MDINTIAKMAGVSRATVSRYLNNGYVSEEKREQIRRVIEQTGYVPSKQAQRLRTGKTNLVGVIIPKINSGSVGRMVSGMTDVFNKSSYQVLLANTANDPKAEVQYLRLFAEKGRVDGVIFIASVFDAAHLRAMDELSVPLVVLGQNLEGYSCVYQDDYRALFNLTERLLRNSEHPAYIGAIPTDVAAGNDRKRGFVDACKAAGLEVPDRAMAVADFTVDSGYTCAEKILEAYPQVDTIVCATDTMAFGAMTCLREYGHRVPEDVQVAGVGDAELSQIITPSLTTVHYYYKTSGAEAANMLVGAMKSTDGVAREVRMGYEIRVRTSTR